MTTRHVEAGMMSWIGYAGRFLAWGAVVTCLSMAMSIVGELGFVASGVLGFLLGFTYAVLYGTCAPKPEW